LRYSHFLGSSTERLTLYFVNTLFTFRTHNAPSLFNNVPIFLWRNSPFRA